MTDSGRGLILINTGPGKAKPPAAMGTALRAVGNGMKVLMLQSSKALALRRAGCGEGLRPQLRSKQMGRAL